jgi:hypothetical protein
MCDPLTIAGLALTAGSTVMNTMAANQAASARNSALQAERARQSGLDREAEALNAQSQDRYKGFEGKQEAKNKELGDYFAGQQTQEPVATETVPTADASNITVQEENRQRSQARADTNESAANLASLRSFGDLLGGISRAQARDAGQIGQIGGFKSGYAGVMPYELEAASQKGAGLRTLGDIMGGIGGLTTSAGLSGKSFGDLTGGISGLFSGGAKGATTAATSLAPATSLIPRPRPTGVGLGSIYGR